MNKMKPITPEEAKAREHEIEVDKENKYQEGLKSLIKKINCELGGGEREISTKYIIDNTSFYWDYRQYSFKSMLPETLNDIVTEYEKSGWTVKIREEHSWAGRVKDTTLVFSIDHK